MSKERDIKNETIEEINGYTIVRSEARDFDKWEQRYSGKVKVYYDVCDDIDLLESFKTLRAARAFCMR